MRNYWMKILLGALVIFAIGMIGVTLARRGMNRVEDVVHGSGPISIPLAIIPFELNGNKLGTLDRLVLERTAPKKITSVRVEVKLEDSLVAQGLSECRLAANLEASRRGRRDVNVNLDRGPGGMFRCVAADSTDTTLVEFGRAILQPGGVQLPLLLPKELVDELQSGNFFSDSSQASDSIADAMQALGDSIAEATDRKLDSMGARNAALSDSLRLVGRRRIDSLKQAALRLADSAKAASLENAPRPR
jgi:hypothetical protein